MSRVVRSEIERKYLIRYPDPEMLRALPECEKWEITQVYLMNGPGGVSRRIRRVLTNGEIHYYQTFKRRITEMSCEEEEREIASELYERLFRERDTRRQPILKTRYRVPYEGHILEFDIFPFWQDRALMEIELSSEDEVARIPDYVSIIRDVTSDRAYKNRQLARRVPMEPV